MEGGNSDMGKWWLRLSLLMNVLLLAVLAYLWQQGGDNFLHELYLAHERRVSSFTSFPAGEGDVVFLGDSLTQEGEWHEIFPDFNVVNRGIGGDSVGGVLRRLNQVTSGQPRAVFLMIGTNDLLYGPGMDISQQEYRQIVERIRSDSPGTRLYLQSLLPRAARDRALVEEFNAFIEGLAAQYDLPYIDLYSHFLGDDGAIVVTYSNDELHLNGPGYLLWRDLLQPSIDGLGAGPAAGH